MYVGIRSETYPLFGKISYLSAGTVYPGIQISLINAAVSLAAIISAGGTSMEGTPSCHLSDPVQCDSSDKQSVVCIWRKILSVYFNCLFEIIYASGNWHMGDVFLS